MSEEPRPAAELGDSVSLKPGPRQASGPGVELRLDRGAVRPRNEDWCAWQIRGGRGAFVVCDGMGGLSHGDRASATAGTLFLRRLFQENECLWPAGGWPDPAAMAAVLEEGLDRLKEELGEARVATTLSGLLVQKRAAMLLHVGDSRAYLLRESRIIQLSRDHTLVSSMQLSEEESLNHPHKHIVTRGIGITVGLELDHRKFRLEDGDRLLLCSDGLWNSGMLRRDILRLALRHRDAADFADALVAEATRLGAPDNLGLLVIDMDRLRR